MSLGGEGSRQRSCNACAKSKRRCDKALPACGRCVKQRYPCSYVGRGQTWMTFGDSGDAAFRLSCPAPVPDPLSAMLGTDLDLIPDTTFQLNSDLDSFLASVPGNSSVAAGAWPSQFTEIGSTSHEKALTRKDYTKMTIRCDDYAPWHLADPSTKSALTMSFVKKFHVTFAHDNGTPYIHRYLYKDNMPRWVLQAYTMCLLYTNQTATNRAIVLRVLYDDVNDLKATASNVTLMPQEKLARVHALMFYQTIRMFDGDITLGQQADDDMALLDSWNNELCKVKDNLDDIADMGNATSEHPPESWERWIFTESLRRTCIMCVCVQKFWELLKTRRKAADIGNMKFIHRWTLSSHLWNARNSFDFFRAWREKPSYIISNFDFDNFLKTGTGDDLDDFAFYFLAL
ncbi:hypothetical protein F5Y09DRAFT_298455 [Xylaria sp. FL1042]|nr:hypothetical protein F5Y09DRAFT_298455 [Xylaria sp. FL1042]